MLDFEWWIGADGEFWMVNGGLAAESLCRVAGSELMPTGTAAFRWGEEGDAVDFSEPSGWVATGGIKHGDFVAFCEAFVDPILDDLRIFSA